MKIVIIGATGTIGRAITEALSPHHVIVRVAHTRGEYNVDIASGESIKTLFETLVPFDAVVCAAGQAAFGPLETLTDDDFKLSLSSKLMGQVNLVRQGMRFISDNGSFTLTSGVLAREPMPGSAAVSLVNAGLEGFIRAAALEAPRGIRVNAVSPPWVKETLEAMGRDSSAGMPAEMVAQAYVASIEGRRTGEVIDPRALLMQATGWNKD
jgi:NAD(P)-dependent dehydrogenase (short-subunit alcohol dehydrogenase family)